MTFEENGSDSVVDESHGLLSLAQKIYEERVSEGEAERARLINEGETLLSQSRHKADNIVADSEREHSDTLDRLRELRQVELDFRDRLFDLLDEAREELDELIAEHEARINGDNVPEEVLDGYYEDYDDDEEISETDEVWDEAEIEDEEESDDDSAEEAENSDDSDDTESTDESTVEEFDDSDLQETVGITDENGFVVEVEDVNAGTDSVSSEDSEISENSENDSDSVSEDFENEEVVSTDEDSSDDEWKDDSSLSSDWEEDGDDQVSDFNDSSDHESGSRSDDRNDDVDAAAERTWSTGEFPRVESSTEDETVVIEPIVDDGESNEEEKSDEPDKFSFFKDPSERGRIVSDDEEDDDEERASWMAS